MEQKPMPVHEVAELTGITVRTLHYYDEIGLLKPEIVTESKYRYYTKNDMERLQEILFFKEAGFALKEIKTLITSEAYDREEQWNHFLMKAKNLFEHLSEYENESPANPEVQKIVDECKR